MNGRRFGYISIGTFGLIHKQGIISIEETNQNFKNNLKCFKCRTGSRCAGMFILADDPWLPHQSNGIQ